MSFDFNFFMYANIVLNIIKSMLILLYTYSLVCIMYMSNAF